MSSGAEVLGNGAIRRQKTLGMPGRLEPLHAILTLPRGARRVLTPVIEVAALPVLYSWQYLAFGRAIAFEFIRNDDPRHVPQPLQELTEKLLRRLLVASALHQDVKDVVILVHRTPQGMALPIDRHTHLVQVPLVARPRAAATQSIGIILPKLLTPLTDSFMGHGDNALEQQLLHIAVAQGKAIGEPDPVADDLAGKAVILVAFGVSRWRHVGCLSGGRLGLRGVIVVGIMSRAGKNGQQLDNAFR